MAELEADTVVILSSELISKIVGEYFNRKMFKESVEIVDLKPTETGYMFSVAFIPVKKGIVKAVDEEFERQLFTALQAQEKEDVKYMATASNVTMPARGSNGKFMKSEVK